MQPIYAQIAVQALSLLVLASGVIYTGRQFAAHRRAQHVANFIKLVEMQMRLRELRVHDPSLAKVYRHDIPGSGTDREIREYFLNLMQLSVFEVAWFSHRQGQIPDDYFQSWVTRMRAVEAEESFRAMISSPGTKILHDEFHRFILSMIRDPGPAPNPPPPPPAAAR